MTNSATPVPVSGGSASRCKCRWKSNLWHDQLSTSLSSAWAATVYCWGDNGSGQLGNGTTTNSSTPTPFWAEIESSYVECVSVASTLRRNRSRAALLLLGRQQFRPARQWHLTNSSVPVSSTYRCSTGINISVSAGTTTPACCVSGWFCESLRGRTAGEITALANLATAR